MTTRKCFLCCLIAVLLVGSQTNLAYAGDSDNEFLEFMDTFVQPLIGGTAELVGGPLGGYTGRYADVLYDRVTGKPNIRKIQSELNTFAKKMETQNREFSEQLYALSKKLDEKMDRQQVQDEISKAMEPVNKKLAMIVDVMYKQDQANQKRFREMQKLLELHQQAIERLANGQKDLTLRVGEHTYRLDLVDTRLDRLDSEIDKAKTLMAEMTLKHAEVGVKGLNEYRDGNYEKAKTIFEQGHRLSPLDPGFKYGLALTYRRLGKDEDALIELKAAKQLATVWQTQKGAAHWWDKSLEKFSLSDRVWLNSLDTKPLVEKPLTTKPSVGR